MRGKQGEGGHTWDVRSLVVSFWRFQTPSRCVKSSFSIRHFGRIRTCSSVQGSGCKVPGSGFRVPTSHLVVIHYQWWLVFTIVYDLFMELSGWRETREQKGAMHGLGPRVSRCPWSARASRISSNPATVPQPHLSFLLRKVLIKFYPNLSQNHADTLV